MRAALIDHNITPTKTKPTEGYLIIKANRKLVRLKTEDIIIIKGLGDYVIIKTLAEKFVVKSTMKEMCASLPPGIFMRTHRSFIVNMDKIKSIDRYIAVLTGQGVQYLAPIGNIYRKAFKKAFLS